MENILGLVALFTAGVVAGAINAVAGGGTLITFPSLVAFGIPVISANATNTTVVWPATVSSAVAYREDMPQDRRLILALLIPSFIGGLLGAIILVQTPESLFAHLVPFLVLFATLVFALSDRIKRLVDRRSDGTNCPEQSGWRTWVWGSAFQLFVAAYGGYFGAGIGILMLASLSVMGLGSIHRMNALKTVLSTVINGVALVYFILRGLVVWQLAIMMAVGSIIGGYGAARLAKRVDQRLLRVLIVLIGLFVSAYLFSRVL